MKNISATIRSYIRRITFKNVLHIILLLTGFFVVANLSSCKGTPNLQAPTPNLDVQATAASLINPGPSGKTSSIVVRVYQLTSLANFSDASFLQLWTQDEQTLGATMLSKEEIYLMPGGTNKRMEQMMPNTGVIAVVAGFRDFENAKWRATSVVEGSSCLLLSVDTLSVDLASQQCSSS